MVDTLAAWRSRQELLHPPHACISPIIIKWRQKASGTTAVSSSPSCVIRCNFNISGVVHCPTSPPSLQLTLVGTNWPPVTVGILQFARSTSLYRLWDNTIFAFVSSILKPWEERAWKLAKRPSSREVVINSDVCKWARLRHLGSFPNS